MFDLNPDRRIQDESKSVPPAPPTSELGDEFCQEGWRPKSKKDSPHPHGIDSVTTLKGGCGGAPPPITTNGASPKHCEGRLMTASPTQCKFVAEFLPSPVCPQISQIPHDLVRVDLGRVWRPEKDMSLVQLKTRILNTAVALQEKSKAKRVPNSTINTHIYKSKNIYIYIYIYIYKYI